MSKINEQIERLRELVRKCYSAVASKNGTIPNVGERTVSNLGAAIESIPSVDDWDVVVNVAPSNMNGFLSKKNNIKSFQLKDNTSTDVSNLLYLNKTIERLDIPKIFPNATRASYFMSGAINLQSHVDVKFPVATDVSGFNDLHNVPSIRLVAPNAYYSTNMSYASNATSIYVECGTYNGNFKISNAYKAKLITIKGYFTTFNGMFSNDSSLETAYIPDLSNVTNIDYCFSFCSKLVNLYIDGRMPNISLSNLFTKTCDALSRDSLMRVIDALPTTTNGYTLGLGATNIAKLTNEEIAVATAKGWTIA